MMCSNLVEQHDDLIVLSGKGLKMLDIHRALVLCSDNKLAIVNQWNFYLYGKSTSNRNFRKVILEYSISLECTLLKYLHLSGALYQATCAWVGEKPNFLSKEDIDKLPVFEGEEGKGIRLLDHNAALIRCKGKNVVLKKTCLYVNRRACDESNFRKLITCGQVIKVNAVPLPVPHSTGAEYKAVCAWVGDKPSSSVPKIVHCQTQDLGRKGTEIPTTPLEVQLCKEEDITSISCSVEEQSPTLNKTTIHPAISSIHIPKLPLKDGIFIMGDNKPVASPFKFKSNCQNNLPRTNDQSHSHASQASTCNNFIEGKMDNYLSNGGNLEYKQDAVHTSQENGVSACQEIPTLSKEKGRGNGEDLIKNTLHGASKSIFLSHSGEQRGDASKERRLETADIFKNTVFPTDTITELGEICGEVTAHITSQEGIIEVDLLGFEVRFSTDHIVSWGGLDLKQKTLAYLAPLGSKIMFCATRNPGYTYFHASKVWMPAWPPVDS